MAISHSAVSGDKRGYNPEAYVLGTDASAALKPQVQEKTLKITSVLQTTLEVSKLIELFAAEVQGAAAHHHVSYRNPAQGIDLSLGKPARHSCTYRLLLLGQSLGELTFTRKKRFSEAEIQLIEGLLTGLVYPLRNALLYHDALQAAFKDPLTGVNNRATMNVVLRREVEIARRYGTPLSFIIMDIDNFKTINDTYGHATGDVAIKSLAERVTECIRSTDILFRYGGEEFTVLLNNTTPDGALLLAERIRHTVELSECDYNNKLINMTVSMGVSYLNGEDDEQRLFEKADSALYQAKSEGRNCVRLLG
jgi:diguanylate cyclase (GGDEF)-like protein